MAAVQLDSGLLMGFLFLATCLVVAVRSYLRSGGADGGRGGAAIPSPPALPVIGNLHQLGRGRHHRALRELARRHGPLFQLRLGSVRALVVSSASMAEAVLRHQDHVFCGRPQQHTARGTLYGCRDVAFSPYGERWRRLRRVAVVHLLSARRVDSFRALREEEVASFVNRIRAASGGGGGVVNLTELIVGLTHAVVSRAAFGKKLGGVEPAKVRETVGELADLLGTIATCRRSCTLRRRRRRRHRHRQGGAAGEDDTPPGGDEGGDAPPPTAAAAHPARGDPGHGAPRPPRRGGDARDDQRVGDREGRGGVGGRGGVQAGEVRRRRGRRRRRVLRRRRRLPVHAVRRRQEGVPRHGVRDAPRGARGGEHGVLV
ncbi:hypothetical protein EE612_033250 [Oryza sativa]|nr:hypothetical protein EE612_033250 [Oryza sativa]